MVLTYWCWTELAEIMSSGRGCEHVNEHSDAIKAGDIMTKCITINCSRKTLNIKFVDH
jgi:hypothetical protein